MTRQDQALDFRRRHLPGAATILVLPNAWDAMSARVIEEAGAPAIATTSSGVSWSLGRPDGEGLTRDEMIAAVRRIAGAVAVPVSADIEGGYGSGTPEDVAETVAAVIAAGAVGVNLEDAARGGEEGLLETSRQVDRIAAARAAATARGELFVNARVDTYLRSVGPANKRLEETVGRARAYVAAGADGIFVPGVVDAPTVRLLAGAIEAPLNVMAGPGAPSIAELRELGVARVSVGPSIALAALGAIRRAATEILSHGTYDEMRGAVDFSEADGLFPRGEGV
ncbi:MAG: isocitrate lyase/phosphoenolpyruvate mutase family protein [Gemmatimonadales bacterium]|nr:isocitrate lyase/phosphoenolpyruvate mutase family protein [Gemmatimonadales bacterium]